jgi:cytidyltransferase-like protein
MTRLISIIPGSFKPPHKGHLSLLEKLIKRKKNSKIIIIISKKARPIDKRFLYMENQKKEVLVNALKDYSYHKENLTKKEIIQFIKKLIEKNIIKTISPEQSLIIWKIYLRYLRKKYDKKIIFPIIEFRITPTNNILAETNKAIRDSFKEHFDEIILMKSMKNANNGRFNFLEKRYGKYIKTILFPDIKNIDATGMRDALMLNNIPNFIKYLPKDLNKNTKLKIYNLLNK